MQHIPVFIKNQLIAYLLAQAGSPQVVSLSTLQAAVSGGVSWTNTGNTYTFKLDSTVSNN